MTRTTIRRWLLAGALCVGAWCATEAADHAANASPPPAAVEQALHGDLIGQLVDSLTAPADGLAVHAAGCPSGGAPDTLDCTPADAATAAAVTGSLAPAAIAATSAAGPPMLARIQHTRARSTIPTRPAAHLDPRPA